MESIIAGLFLHNWQRKLVAVLTALVLWLLVNHSISETKTITNIPVRIINLPPDKTIRGLLPNGMLSRRITLTLTGSKEVIDHLESSDLEVLLDASTTDSDDWIVQISKKNLVTLNPSIDLLQHISQVGHADFIVKLSNLVTARIPLTILPPIGKPPSGYEYLDVWPQYLTQTVSGPAEEVQALKEKGLEITFDLENISKADLDAIKSQGNNDEISFIVPKKWKQVSIPFHHNNLEDMNDPEAQNLSIDFLRQKFLPLDKEIPISVYYPLEDLDQLNPNTVTLLAQGEIEKRHGVNIFTKPVYTKSISRLFIEVIRDSIEIVIVAVPKHKREILAWSVQFINPHYLEDIYIASFIANSPSNKGLHGMIPKKREDVLRKRFRTYMQRLTLYLVDTKKLHLKSTIEDKEIRVIAY